MTDPFVKSARVAKNRGSLSVARRIIIEGKMAKALIKAIIDRGYVVSINDGEEDVGTNITCPKEAVGLMFTSDEDVISFSKNNEQLGWFYLVYGNDGWDVISDYSYNDVCESIWKENLEPLSNKLEAGV